jgi:beta-phosphoglucomutase-like phosphatase (HAD superfamily)
MIYEAVLFDMDGVITDTRQSVITFWHNFAAEQNAVLTQADFLHHIHGCTAEHTLLTLFPHLSEQQRQAVYSSVRDHEATLHYQEVHGAIALLRELKYYGIPTALVTSGTRWRADMVVRQLGIEELLTTQVTAEHISQGKPDPACYLLAAQALRTSPSACLVFEDALSGVKAATAAGGTCIGVQAADKATPLLQAGAQTVIPDFTAVTLHMTPHGELLLSLNGKAERTFLLRNQQAERQSLL